VDLKAGALAKHIALDSRAEPVVSWKPPPKDVRAIAFPFEFVGGFFEAQSRLMCSAGITVLPQ